MIRETRTRGRQLPDAQQLSRLTGMNVVRGNAATRRTAGGCIMNSGSLELVAVVVKNCSAPTEGVEVGTCRFRRLYTEEGMGLRTRRKKKRASQTRIALPAADAPGQHWCMDFMHEQLGDGQRFRTFNVLDTFSRCCLAVVAQRTFRPRDVTEVLDRLIEEHGTPLHITCDNGTEFTANHFDAWAYDRGVFTDFIAPGKPVQNGFIESFNGKLRVGSETSTGHVAGDSRLKWSQIPRSRHTNPEVEDYSIPILEARANSDVAWCSLCSSTCFTSLRRQSWRWLHLDRADVAHRAPGLGAWLASLVGRDRASGKQDLVDRCARCHRSLSERRAVVILQWAEVEA